MAGAVGAFKNDQARERFGALLQAAMARWPDRRDIGVDTSFGRTIVSETLDSGDGAPLILLQGGSSTSSIWADFAREWSRSRPVMAIDTVWDAGRSTQDRPVSNGAEATAWLDETLDGMGCDRVHLLGYSYGGWLALEYAARRAGRLHSTIAIEPPGAITGIGLAAWWRIGRMIIGGDREFRSYLSWIRGGGLPDAEALALLTSAQTDFVRRGSPLPRRLSADDWKQISQPLMILVGGTSQLVPRSATARVAEQAPQAEIQVIERAGHAVLTEDPTSVISLVDDFLRHALTDSDE